MGFGVRRGEDVLRGRAPQDLAYRGKLHRNIYTNYIISQSTDFLVGLGYGALAMSVSLRRRV